MDASVALLVAVGLLASGCMHEQLAWPPTSETIRSINEAAGARNGWFQVEYVEPLATDQGAHVHSPKAIAAVDLEHIALQTRDGEIQRIPIATVRSVIVYERGTGALIGAGIGLAGGAAVLAVIELVASRYVQRDQASGFVCEKDCATQAAGFLATDALIGAAVGYLVSARVIYEVGGAR